MDGSAQEVVVLLILFSFGLTLIRMAFLNLESPSEETAMKTGLRIILVKT